MASESSGNDFEASVFQFCANTTNVIVIFICPLEVQGVRSILKMLKFILYSKIFKILTTLNILFFDFTKYFNISSYGGLEICTLFHGF
jgi:hypothetical protein